MLPQDEAQRGRRAQCGVRHPTGASERRWHRSRGRWEGSGPASLSALGNPRVRRIVRSGSCRVLCKLDFADSITVSPGPGVEREDYVSSGGPGLPGGGRSHHANPLPPVLKTGLLRGKAGNAQNLWMKGTAGFARFRPVLKIISKLFCSSF